MNTPTLNENFAAALRDGLVERASQSSAPRRRRKGLWLGAGAGLAVMLAGAGTAIATGAFVLPGGTEVTDLAVEESGTFQGDGSLYLGEPPEGTTAVAYSFACLTPGKFVFDSGGYSYCGSADAEREGTSGFGIIPIEDIEGNRVTVSTSPEAEWSLTANYVHTVVTDWAVNESGQTYGVANEHGMPDLVGAVATNGLTGYILREDIMSPTPANPEEAAELMKNYPTEPTYIPVYAADGVTVIGEFEMGPAIVEED